MDEKVKKLEAEIEAIKARNKRVEADKAWELSKTRITFISISTYFLIVFFMYLLNDSHPFLNALVATVAYLLSTSTYGALKSWWLKRERSN